MNRLPVIALRIAGWMLALVVAVAAVFALVRAAAVDDADLAAVALMEVAPPPPAGSNGFALLMTAGRDLPASRREAAVAEDVAAFAAWERGQLDAQSFWDATAAGDGESFVAFEPLAAVPAASPLPDAASLCPLSGEGCLEQVAADAAASRTLLAAQAGRIAAVEAALAADHITSPYPPSMYTPLPPLQLFRLPLAAAALDAVDGRVDAAFARTCRLLAGARRTDRQARTLIDKMVAQALARGAATLLLDLRRSQPGTPLPGECAAARVPVAVEEASVCEALRGEFRLHRAYGAQVRTQLAGWRPDRVLTRALLVDDRLQAVALARVLAPSCTGSARELAAQGLPPEAAATPAPLTGAACWAAYVSCVLANIAMPAYDRYGELALDHAAVLRLLLAAQRVADGEASPARASVEAAVEGYPVDYDAAAQRATIVLKAPRGDDATFSVDFTGLAPAPVLRSSDAIAAVARH